MNCVSIVPILYEALICYDMFGTLKDTDWNYSANFDLMHLIAVNVYILFLLSVDLGNFCVICVLVALQVVHIVCVFLDDLHVLYNLHLMCLPC